MPLKLIKTANADASSNCHGWVFASGRFHVRGFHVDPILSDNAYSEVPQPQPGDVIVYRDSSGTPVHTGVVRFAGSDTMLIESKWGQMGRFLHTPENQPYSSEWKYYRSSRDGHALQIESGPWAAHTSQPSAN
jgi:hypothetical protein